VLSDNPKLTRRKRRRMILACYSAAFLLATVAVYLLHFRHVSVFRLGGYFPLLLSFIIVLGGLRLGGPVRPFSRRIGAAAANQPLIQLRLGSRKHPPDETFLDERDIAIGDHVHCLAMSILRCATFLFVLALWASAVFHHPAWLPVVAGIGSFLLFVAAMSLPQGIILRAEPDPVPEPSAQIAGVPQ